MAKAKKISELDAVLDEVLGNREEEYRRAIWLKSDFYAAVWYCVFGDHSSFVIDFRIKVDNDELLTSSRHSRLLETIKCWLTSQTHSDLSNGHSLGGANASYLIRDTLQIIDYLLLNSKQLRIADFGLECLTEGDILRLLVDLSSSSRKSYSIYRWPERLATFLKDKTSSESEYFYINALKENPWLGEDLPDVDESDITLSEAEIIKSRIWLWVNGFYKYSTDDHSTNCVYKYQLKTIPLAKLIYSETLRGCTQKPQINSLKLYPIQRYKTEFRAALVSNQDETTLNDKLLSKYYRIITGLGCLKELGLQVPSNALDAVSNLAFRNSLITKQTGRFKTLPAQVVFSALRTSIEFIIKYGDSIVDSVLLTMKSFADAKCKPQYGSFIIELPPELRKALSARHWSLLQYIRLNECNRNHQNGLRVDGLGVHTRIRNHEGLFELTLVLYGAVQICVGTLMSRRQGELIDLVAGEAIDDSDSYLIFENRKSGFDGIRDVEARPIPLIAVRAIRVLERLQDGLLQAGIISKKTGLFACPTIDGTGLVEVGVATFNRSLNFFCDYAQIPLTLDGKRYYIRQHQLRRFFAMLFFWGGSFGGMETLRWFLGHTDVTHLYHYITESVTGEVLRSIQAQFAVEMVVEAETDVPELASLIEDHFGTRNFSVLDSEELDEYVEELIIEGTLLVEPEFFDTPEGQSYKIIVKVTSLGQSNEH